MCEHNLTSCLGFKNTFLGIRTKLLQWMSSLLLWQAAAVCRSVALGEGGEKEQLDHGCGIGRKP